MELVRMLNLADRRRRRRLRPCGRGPSIKEVSLEGRWGWAQKQTYYLSSVRELAFLHEFANKGEDVIYVWSIGGTEARATTQVQRRIRRRRQRQWGRMK